jgi:hypothetical protein
MMLSPYMIAVRNVQGLFKLNKTIMNLVRTAVLKASDVNKKQFVQTIRSEEFNFFNGEGNLMLAKL